MISRRAGGERALNPAQIERQHRQLGLTVFESAGHHRIGVGHLRHLLGIDEARRLDPAQTGLQRTIDELELVGGGQHRLFVLQPVAGADLHKLDARRHRFQIHPFPAKFYMPNAAHVVYNLLRRPYNRRSWGIIGRSRNDGASRPSRGSYGD